MRRISAIVSTVRTLTLTSIEIELRRLDGLPFPKFLPGQYATISFPAYRALRGERAFSIVSPPTRLDSIRFCIRTHGKHTSALRRIQRGDTAQVGGPYGTFTFDPKKDRTIVLVAGGIGVTPFVSMVHYVVDRRLSNPVTLLYSVRSLDDAAYRGTLDEAVKQSPNIRVIYAVTNEKVRHEKDRIIPGYITRALLWWAMGEKADGQSLYVSGPKSFMDAMQQQLGTLGVSRSRIRAEKFSAGSSDLIERATPIPFITLAVWGTAALALVGGIARIEHGRRAAIAVPLPTATTSITNQTTNSAVQPNTNTAVPTQRPSTSPKTTNTGVTPKQPKPAQSIQQPVAPKPAPMQPRTRMS